MSSIREDSITINTAKKLDARRNSLHRFVEKHDDLKKRNNESKNVLKINEQLMAELDTLKKDMSEKNKVIEKIESNLDAKDKDLIANKTLVKKLQVSNVRLKKRTSRVKVKNKTF